MFHGPILFAKTGGFVWSALLVYLEGIKRPSPRAPSSKDPNYMKIGGKKDPNKIVDGRIRQTLCNKSCIHR